MIRCDVCKSDIDDPCISSNLGNLTSSGHQCGLREALIKEKASEGIDMISKFLNEDKGEKND
tara:strand:+ start:217 stop:402 length:186 start_codon:yes stop_codon:yes gene_type:complete